MIRKNLRKDLSGKLYNPGKFFLLKLAARIAQEAGLQMVSNGLNFARKVMIIEGMFFKQPFCERWSIYWPPLQTRVQMHKNVVHISCSTASEK